MRRALTRNAAHLARTCISLEEVGDLCSGDRRLRLTQNHIGVDGSLGAYPLE